MSAFEAALERVRAPLERHLDAVTEAFGLSPFERGVLVLAAGTEIDPEVARLCGEAHGDPARTYATFGLALAALPASHWSAVVPAAPLRRWRLVELEGASPARDPLRITERVLHFLLGVDYLDEALGDVLHPLPDSQQLGPSQAALAADLAAHLEARGTASRIQLHGRDGGDLRAVAAAGCAMAGLRAYSLAAAEIPADPHAVAELERLWERETVLSPVALVVEGDLPEHASRFASRVAGPVVAAASVPAARLPGTLALELRRPRAAELEVLWEDSLGPHAERLNGTLQRLAGQFELDAGAIQQVAEQAQAEAGEEAGLLEERLWHGCRTRARGRLDQLAQRLEPSAGWDDLVLPARQRETLHEIAAQVRSRATVYERWGFGRQESRGLGIAALFTGPSGTGKTLAGEVLAHELRLDVYRIDLSAVVSKYIGETEKNLRQLFDAAEGTGAILLFDEADALFGKRTEVRDSHDRYANIEVSYLLQRMEAYRGLAILTTNLRNAIDGAFMRRIRFVVSFPLPDAAHRREIWARAFPAETPVGELDLGRLAELQITGGSIRNIAVNAAFLAADASEPVEARHVMRAVRREFGKLGRPLAEEAPA